jgi:CheY-like chemotaxis protein
LIRGDPNRVRQVLLNLAGNAVKFTAEGEVVIHVHLLSSGFGDHELRFTVADTGIGMSPDIQESIFSPFAQGDASTTRRYGGTGLGLTICRRLVALFGGTIWFDSKPGAGSQFHFTGRFSATEQPVSVTEDAVLVLLQTPTRCLNLLVAEDNAVNQLVMTRMLRKLGHAVTVVSDGRSAVEAVGRDDYDIVFMDVQMPELDGYQATQKIRETEGVQQRIRICALTAHALQEDKQRCLDAGMDDFLTKPIDPLELNRVLSTRIAPLPEKQSPTLLSAMMAARHGSGYGG